jgi:hypothetical protein
VVPQEPEAPAQEAKPAECEANCAHHHPVRLSWAKLLKRVFDLDLEHCSNCGGEMKVIAAILEQPVIERILTHLGLRAQAPPRTPARGPHLQAALPTHHLFMRPGTQPRVDRLHPGFAGPSQCSGIVGVNARLKPMVHVLDRGHRHSPGRHQRQRPYTEPRPMVLATPPRPQRQERVRLNGLSPAGLISLKTARGPAPRVSSP